MTEKPKVRRRRGYVCGCCAVCCREMIVPVNDADVRRLAKSSGLTPARIVGFYGSRHVEFDDESPLWVYTRYGARIMALKRIGNKCRFLNSAGRCRLYANRPSTCRTFPYEIRFNGSPQRPVIERTDWMPCPAQPGLVMDWDKVLWARLREKREDDRFYRRLRVWEETGTGRTTDLLDFLFG